MTDLERNAFLTPRSPTSANEYLLPYFDKKKEKDQPLYVKYKPPYAIITFSILEVSVKLKLRLFSRNVYLPMLFADRLSGCAKK